MTDEDKILNRILKSWEVQVAIPATFKAQVWQKLETEASRGSFATYSPFFWKVFQKPRIAFALLVLSLCLGSALSYWHTTLQLAQLDISLKTKYFQALNPDMASEHSL